MSLNVEVIAHCADRRRVEKLSAQNKTGFENLLVPYFKTFDGDSEECLMAKVVVLSSLPQAFNRREGLDPAAPLATGHAVAVYTTTNGYDEIKLETN